MSCKMYVTRGDVPMILNGGRELPRPPHGYLLTSIPMTRSWLWALLGMLNQLFEKYGRAFLPKDGGDAGEILTWSKYFQRPPSLRCSSRAIGLQGLLRRLAMVKRSDGSTIFVRKLVIYRRTFAIGCHRRSIPWLKAFSQRTTNQKTLWYASLGE